MCFFDIFFQKSQQELFIQHFRSSLLQMFCEIDGLTNFANFTGKHLCWSPFYRTPPVAASDTYGPMVATYVKQVSVLRVIPIL